MKKAKRPEVAPSLFSVEYKAHETGLDTVFMGEVSDCPIEEPKELPPVGTWMEIDQNPGAYPTKTDCMMEHEMLSEDGLREKMTVAANAALADAEAPLHVRSLASRILESLQRLPKVESAMSLAGLYQRLIVWKSERPAAAGQRIREAAKRKGRAAPEKSLRYFFNSKIPDWQTMSNARLLIAAKKQFPQKEQSNLSRQIRAMKKRGF